ncbi:unnamed protein product, partial [Medioppia subpectinata]
MMVKRIQHHPSIALWAGNNENEQGLAGWWKPHLPQYDADYRALYIGTIGKILSTEDTTRPYAPSSPSNGLQDIKDNYTSSNPEDSRYGDIHYYNDGSRLWDWTTFWSPKFASEYGFQSYPSLETLHSAFDDKDLVYPLAPNVQHHQHHPGGDQTIDKQIDYYLRRPSSGGIDRLNDFVYSSQIIQAMAMKTETEFYRRNRAIDPNSGNGYTMGALYWQLNDIWPAPSWASIEHNGKWKVLHSYVIHFLDNHLVSPYEDRDKSLKVSFVRDDYLGELSFNYSIKVYKWSQNTAIYTIDGLAKTDSISAQIIYSTPITDILSKAKCVDRNDCILSVNVNNMDHKINANNFMLLTEPKNSKLVKPELKLIEVKKKSVSESNDNNHVFEITLSSQSIAAFVVMDFKPK